MLWIPLAILACLLWSSAFAAVKLGLEHMTPWRFAGLRFMLAGLLLVPLCGRPGEFLRAVRRQWRLVGVVSLLQIVILYGTMFPGMAIVTGAQGAVIIGAAPLASALMAHWFMHDDRMTFGKAGAIALGVAGVAVIAIAMKPWSAAGLGELGGMGLLMVGVVSSAIAGVFVARARGGITPLQLNGAQIALGGAVLFALGTIAEPANPFPPIEFFAVLLWMAVISAAGFSIWFALLRRVKVSQLNMWKFLIPVFGAIFSWLIVPGESADWPTAAGMLCVTAAVWLNHWMTARATR